MCFSIFYHINYVAVLISAIAMFVLGSMWFSFLFSKTWVEELGLHNVTIGEPTQEKIFVNMGLSFFKNIVIAFAMACLVYATNSVTLGSGLCLGLLIAIGFSAPAIADVFIWENRSLKLYLIDAGYQMLAVIVAAIILSLWR